MLTNAPVERQEAEALLQDCLNRTSARLALAVSGGADSMAMLWLVSKVVPASNILVLTVDHGLRSGSAEEAASVADWCAGQGIEHQTLLWAGEKPDTAVQAQARSARYRLLASVCNEQEIQWLLTAHNADDQAETVFARLARGSGPPGLAGMRPRIRIAAGAGEPVVLCRPFLGISRARLRATAKVQKLPFFDDPGNNDATYERIRRRAFLGAIEAQDLLEKKMLLRTATRMREAAAREEEALRQEFMAAGGWFHGSGAICLELSRLQALSRQGLISLLSRAIEAVSGNDHAPDDETLQKDIPQVLAGVTVTLGGAMIRTIEKKIWILREPAALGGRRDGSVKPYRIEVTGEKKILWDSRLIVNLSPETPSGACLAPLPVKKNAPLMPNLLASSLPGLWSGESLLAVPDCAKKILSPAHTPWKQGVSTLDIRPLTKERFNRRVIRF